MIAKGVMEVVEMKGMTEGNVMAKGITETAIGRGSDMIETLEVEEGEATMTRGSAVTVVVGGTRKPEQAEVQTLTRIEIGDLGMTRKRTLSL